MASYAELRKQRQKQGEDAKARVLGRAAGTYRDTPTTAASQATANKFDAIRSRTALEGSITAKQNAEKAKQAANTAAYNTYHSVMDTTNLHLQPQAPKSVQPDYLKPKSAPADLNAAIQNFSSRTPVKSHNEQIADNLKKVPVVGSVIRGLDWLSDKTAPAANVALEYYTPGAGLSAINAAEQAGAGLVSKLLPGAGKLATRAAVDTGIGAVTGAGQSLASHPEEGLEGAAKGALAGAAFGAAAPVVGAGIKAAATPAISRISQIADNLVSSNPVYRSMVQQVGEATTKAEAGKQMLSDIDNQLDSLGRGNAPDKADQFKTLLNERADTVDYIKQHEPDFEAPKPRIRDSGVQPARNDIAPDIGTTQPSTLPTTVETPSAFTKVRTRNASATTPKQPLVRGFMQTMDHSENIAPEVKAGLAESAQRSYKPITNADTLKRANRAVLNDVDKVEGELLSKRKYTADDVAKGIRTVQELQKTGQHERAVSIAEKLSTHLTEAGQTVQAASILERLSPEGALLMVQRKVNKLNDGLLRGQKRAVLKPEQAESIQTAAQTLQAAGASQERAGTVLQLMTKARNGETLSSEERQVVADFVEDAKRYVKPEDVQPPKEIKRPAKMSDSRTRDKVTSFLDQKADEARKRIAARRNTLSANPFDTWSDMAIIATSHVANGLVKFADFSSAMIQEFGDAVRPQLRSLFDRASSGLQEAVDRVTNQESGALADAVRNAIDNANNGNLTTADLDNIKALSKQFVDNLPPTKAIDPIKEDEQRFMTAVKSLAKKINGIESSSSAPSTNTREVKALLQRVSDVLSEDLPKADRPKINMAAMDELAYKLNDRAMPSEAEKIAKAYIKNNESLSADDVQLVRDLATKVSELSGKERNAASQDLHAILNNFEKVGVGRKLSSAQYISMLLNPLTQIRNIAGNELMYRLERLGRMIGTPIDMIAAGVSGKPRQVTFKSGPRVWDNFFKPASDYWTGLGEGAKAGWRGTNPEGLTSKYEIQGQAFKSKYNPLTYMEKALGATMKGFDHAAYTRTVNQQLREMAYLDALNKGVKGAEAQRNHIQDYMANIDDATHEIAQKYGKYVTLQDDSLISKGIQGIRKGLNFNQNFGAGSVILPFAKTPGNLLDRTLDYSPVGILKAMKNTYNIIRDPKTDLTRADVIANVSRSLLGSGIGALGYYLANLGVLQGKSSDDPEVRKLMAQGGVKDFQINGTALRRVLSAVVHGEDVKDASKMQPGDTLWAYQWAAPTSAPLAVGNTIYQGARTGSGKKGVAGAAETGGKAALNGLETLFDSSVLSGVQEAFNTNPGESQPGVGVAMNVLKSLPGMFLPSAVRQYNTLTDNRTKETYSPDGLQSYINPTYQNIPGNNLPQRVDTLGHPMTKPSSFFDVFLSPAARSEYKPTKEAEFLIDLLNETGDQTLAPRAVAKYVQGKDTITGQKIKKDLSTEQYVKLQTLVGQKTAELINQINPNLPTETKVKAVIKALNAAGAYGRTELKKELGLK